MTFDIQASADFEVSNGTLKKELHSSNAAPPLSSKAISDFTEKFRELHFHSARNHDWALWNPGQRMIDTHFIFPLFKLDPNDPSNYYFDSSDAMIQNCLDTGTEVYYRLGTSIEHAADKHFNTVPPTDFEKYAEILAGIVRHYNHGWAKGFHHNIKYWEVWNEAEAPNCWDGPVSEYYRLFITVYKRLKREFPEIKVGGPAFWSLQEKTYTPFLTACKNAGIAPDFLSWHSYENDPEKIIGEPVRAKALLDSFGFHNTELHLNEWHFLTSWDGLHRNVTQQSFMHNQLDPDGMTGIDSAAFNLAALIGWHNTPMDCAFYYGANPKATTWGFYHLYNGLNKNYYSMKMFGTILSQCPNRVKTESMQNNLYVIASQSDDKKTGMILLSDFRGDSDTLRIRINGMKNAKVSAAVLDNTRDCVSENAEWKDDILTLTKKEKGSAAYLISFAR